MRRFSRIPRACLAAALAFVAGAGGRGAWAQSGHLGPLQYDADSVQVVTRGRATVYVLSGQVRLRRADDGVIGLRPMPGGFRIPGGQAGGVEIPAVEIPMATDGLFVSFQHSRTVFEDGAGHRLTVAVPGPHQIPPPPPGEMFGFRHLDDLQPLSSLVARPLLPPIPAPRATKQR